MRAALVALVVGGMLVAASATAAADPQPPAKESKRAKPAAEVGAQGVLPQLIWRRIELGATLEWPPRSVLGEPLVHHLPGRKPKTRDGAMSEVVDELAALNELAAELWLRVRFARAP